MQRAIIIATLVLASSTFVTAQNQCWLTAPMALGLPADSEVAGLGDADLDGDVDAIVKLRASGIDSCAVLFNNGCDLTLGPAIAIPSGRGNVIAYTDIGGDGIPDLLVATVETISPGPGPGIYIYQGLAGGTFAPPVFRLTWGYVVSFEEGNFNGDGLPDFFSQERTGSVLVSLWYGSTTSNTLTGSPVSTLPFSVLGSAGAYMNPTVVLDLDGDQVDDVAMVTTNGSTDQLSLFRTTPTGMVQMPPVPTGNGFSYVKELAIVDSDHDGDDDIVISFTSQLQVVEQAAPGVWQALPVVSGPAFGPMVTGDWDGDGDTDLIIRESQTAGAVFHRFRFLESIGGHAFNVIGPLAAGSAYAQPVECADMNGDGFLDYVETSNIIYGDGTFTPLLAGGELLVDWDGDGDLDFTNGDTLYLGDGDNRYDPSPLPFPAPPVGLQQAAWYDLGDTNGDGQRELVVRYSPSSVMRVLSVTPSGGLLDVGPGPLLSTEPKQVVMDDFNGNGLPDLYAYEHVYINDGNYGFTQGAYLGQSARPVAVIDLDGDGDRDVVTRAFASNTLQVAWRTGNTFTVATISPSTGWQSNVPLSTLIADLDDDGDADIAATFPSSNGDSEVRILVNNAGVFTNSLTVPFRGPLTAGDVDGDGLTDLGVSDRGRLGVLRRNGAGISYDPVQVFQMEVPTHLVDLDQDGDLDAFGGTRARSPRFLGPDAGYRRQYGAGSAGTGNWTPQTSITGIVREGETPSIELTRGLGGSVGFLIVGLAEANSPSPVLSGVQDYIGAIQIIAGFGLTGTLGQAGAGTASVPLPIPAGAFGTNWFLEFVVYDPALPGQFSHTNGCEMFVGL